MERRKFLKGAMLGLLGSLLPRGLEGHSEGQDNLVKGLEISSKALFSAARELNLPVLIDDLERLFYESLASGQSAHVNNVLAMLSAAGLKWLDWLEKYEQYGRTDQPLLEEVFWASLHTTMALFILYGGFSLDAVLYEDPEDGRLYATTYTSDHSSIPDLGIFTLDQPRRRLLVRDARRKFIDFRSLRGG